MAGINRGELHHSAKLTTEKVRSIYEDPRTMRVIAAEYGVTVVAVFKIKHRRSWRKETADLAA